MDTSLTAPVLGLAGVVVGVALKAGIDFATQGRQDKREDTLRFGDERRHAFSALVQTTATLVRSLDNGDPPDPGWAKELDARAADLYMVTKTAGPIALLDEVYGVVESLEEGVRRGPVDVAPLLELLSQIANEGRVQIGLPEVDFNI